MGRPVPGWATMTTLLLALLTTCLVAAPALAGTISMNISQSAELRDGSLVVKVMVALRGAMLIA